MSPLRRRAAMSQAHPLDGARPSGRSRVGDRSVGMTVVALATVVLVVGLGMFGFNPFGLGGAGAGGPGDGATSGPGAASPGTPTRPPLVVPVPGHEVYGYVPYWEMDGGIVDHLAATDLTTVALFSVTHRSDGDIASDLNGFKRITGDVGRAMIASAHDRGTRVELVYSSFGEDKNRGFYRNDDAQARWIEVLVEFVAEHGFDGVNVDVELLPADLVPAYGVWVGRLREALRERIPDAQVSVATQANQCGAAMAAAAVLAGADRIFLMGYDYHWPGSQPGASAPIERFDGDERDLVWSLDRYASLGVPVERTILGLPLYGITWPVSGPGLGAPSLGRGDTWVPRRNLAVFEDEAFAPVYDPTESVEFYAVPQDGADPVEGPFSAVYFDSPRSLGPKLQLANERGLAGAGFWAIGYERGLPGYTELIATFRAGDLE